MSIQRHIFFFLLFLIITLFSRNSLSQEVDFGSYSSAYTVTLSELNMGEDLDFGLLIQNEGLVTLPIAESKVLTIEAVKYLDVIVDITADDYLLLNGNLSCATDPNCRIPYTLQASYANAGTNSFSQAKNITVVSNVASTQFQVLRRTSGPPQPPPTPVYEGYNPSLFLETAYIYIYGSLNVGNITAGSYTGDITLTVNYD